MYLTTTGLVLRETTYKESSKILTVLTADEGRITVMAKGARRRGSKTAGAAQLLAYSAMTLYNSKGRWTLAEAHSIEMFQGLRDDIELLSLGSYFAELLEALSDEDSPSPEMLSLGLNALFALSELKKQPELVKAVFEMRLMCAAGFEPNVYSCGICGTEDMSDPVLSFYGGTVCCKKCGSLTESECAPLCSDSLKALKYIIKSDPKKLYSFNLTGAGLKKLSSACERYALVQTDRYFKTLDFYKSVRIT